MIKPAWIFWIYQVKTYLILYNALNSSPSEIETVAECKVAANRWFGSAASKFLQLLLHGAIFPQDETWWMNTQPQTEKAKSGHVIGVKILEAVWKST